MKVVLRGYGVNMTPQQKFNARAQAADMTRTRTTSNLPQSPRGVNVQSASRGILVSWSLPAGFSDDINRWRVYKDTESNLYQEIANRATRQCFVEATAGSSPPTTNVFVSAMNALGYESPKIQAQGKATAEAGAPSVPSSIPSGGGTSGGYQGGLIQKGTKSL